MARNWVVIGTALGATLLATAADASSARYHSYGVGRSGAVYYPGYYIGYWQTPDTGHALSGFQGRGQATAISSAGPAIAATPSLAKTISMAATAIILTNTTIAWVVAGVADSGGSGPYRIGLILILPKTRRDRAAFRPPKKSSAGDLKHPGDFLGVEVARVDITQHQVRPAISTARKPAFSESKTIARSRGFLSTARSARRFVSVMIFAGAIGHPSKKSAQSQVRRINRSHRHRTAIVPQTLPPC